MSQVSYRDSFTDSIVMGDERLYTYTPTLGASTLSHGTVQSVESAPVMGGPAHGLWSNEHPPTAGPYYSAMNHPNYHPQAPYTSTAGHDNLPHTTTQLAEHRGNQTNHADYYYGPTASSHLQLEHYAPMVPEVPSDDPLGYYAHIPENVAGPSRDNSSPGHSRIQDDEDLKRLANRYLNDHGTHVDKLVVKRRFPGGRRVLIFLEIDDVM